MSHTLDDLGVLFLATMLAVIIAGIFILFACRSSFLDSQAYREILLSDVDSKKEAEDESTTSQSRNTDGLIYLIESKLNRFEITGEPRNRDQALTTMEHVLLQIPRQASKTTLQLDRQTVRLAKRYEHQGNLSDLDKAIKSLSRVVSLSPKGYSDILVNLNNLVTMLHKRYEYLGELSDIDKAIEYNTLAVSLTPPGHFSLPLQLHNLGSVLYNRFERLGELSDLNSALEYSTRAISLTPQGDSSMQAPLNNLGLLHWSRFHRLGEVSDLDRAIALYTQAASFAPEGAPLRPIILNNLGLSLHNRFQRLRELSDLAKAIDYLTETISSTSYTPYEMSTWLNNLGSALNSRYIRIGQLSDLEKAIEHHTRAVSLRPKNHPDNLMLLNNLSLALQNRFGHLGELSDLDKGIENMITAVALAPPGHTFLPILLTNLGRSFHGRFDRLGELSDLDEAIKYSTQAISLAPESHSLMPAYLNKLGLLYLDRFNHSGKNEDIKQAVTCFQKSAESTAGDPTHRFEAARQWARLCSEHRIPSLIEAYRRAMTLLPQLVWLGTTVDGRYRYVMEAGHVSTEAAAAAISMKDYRLAIEWLEEGRLIVWKQILQLRTPIDDLSAIAPTLAAELKQVASELEHASSPTSTNSGVLQDNISLERATRQHHRLAERWQELIDEVRDLPGFDTFLHPQNASELMRSAQSGPVVIINIHKTRCDALVIEPSTTVISHVPLHLSFETVKRARAQLLGFVRSKGLLNRGFQVGNNASGDTLSKTLLVLWREVVQPVLVHLGYTVTVTTGDLPHVTWCTTGPLSFLPLHAAGDYEAQSRVFDYVVSSYTPTLSALLSPPVEPALFSGFLAVGQSSTSGMPPLPGTAAELSQIQEKSTGVVFTRLDEEAATPNAVLSTIEEHSWVHLACHAKQDTTHPLLSAFYLYGGMLNLASITQKQLRRADLAFLSACQTAAGDERLPEEAVHLAAGMLMAGYRGVIATMWSIGDEDAPLIAEKVYEHLFEGGQPDARRAAVAVHKATECLRAKVGVKAFTKWVPYIRIGL